MRPSRVDIARLVLGSPRRRAVYEVGRAMTTAAITAAVLLVLYRISVELDFVGRVGFRSGDFLVGVWSPYWWNWVWFAVLLALYASAVLLALRHVERSGGLLGTAVHVVSVPLGTVIYQWTTVAYPRAFRAFLSPDQIFVHRFGYLLLEYPGVPHWLDYLVGIAAVVVIFGVGRHLSTRSDRMRTDLLVTTTLFVGAFLSGYIEPVPESPLIVVAPTTVPTIRYPIGYGVVLAAVGWVLLRAVRSSAMFPGESPIGDR